MDRPTRSRVQHGTRSCYQYGCRRPECREAATAYSRQARATLVRLGRRTLHHAFWTPEETALAMRTDLTIAQIAQMVGRSERAVQVKRYRTRKEARRA